MEETCKLRQENELQAIQAIYMDDFQDLLEKVVSGAVFEINLLFRYRFTIRVVIRSR